jgi:hypothetical protein
MRTSVRAEYITSAIGRATSGAFYFERVKHTRVVRVKTSNKRNSPLCKSGPMFDLEKQQTRALYYTHADRYKRVTSHSQTYLLC